MKASVLWLVLLGLGMAAAGQAAGSGRAGDYRAADGTILKGYLVSDDSSPGRALPACAPFPSDSRRAPRFRGSRDDRG